MMACDDVALNMNKELVVNLVNRYISNCVYRVSQKKLDSSTFCTVGSIFDRIGFLKCLGPRILNQLSYAAFRNDLSQIVFPLDPFKGKFAKSKPMQIENSEKIALYSPILLSNP